MLCGLQAPQLARTRFVSHPLALLHGRSADRAERVQRVQQFLRVGHCSHRVRLTHSPRQPNRWIRARLLSESRSPEGTEQNWRKKAPVKTKRVPLADTVCDRGRGWVLMLGAAEFGHRRGCDESTLD